jgi:hypothetical protein
MKVNAAMMCLAAAMLAFPFPAYLPYWLFGLSALVEVFLAGKLSSVTTLLAGQVSAWSLHRGAAAAASCSSASSPTLTLTGACINPRRFA